MPFFAIGCLDLPKFDQSLLTAFGEAVYEKRNRLGWTGGEFTNAVNGACGNAMISRIENGRQLTNFASWGSCRQRSNLTMIGLAVFWLPKRKGTLAIRASRQNRVLRTDTKNWLTNSITSQTYYLSS